MQRILLSLFISLILITSISADTDICKKVYYFIIDNPSFNNQQAQDFINENNLNITSEFFYNFEKVCQGSNFQIPKVSKNLSNLIIINDSKTCSTNIENKIANFDLDWSIPFPKVDTPMSCGWINNLKFFLRIEKVDNNTFISGLKIWWIVFLGLFLFFLTLILILRRTNKYLKSN